MADRDKVIKGLGELSGFLFKEYGKAQAEEANIYYDRFLSVDDALSLLKEQEAIEPRRIDGKRNHFIKCGNCNYDLLTGYMFCPHCGRPVKWDV